MIYLGRSVNRTASYFCRAAAQRASDPIEFHRRYLKGIATQQDIQKTALQRAIEQESNAEIRRVMVERYGAERFLFDSGAKLIARDSVGLLYRKDLADDEPLVMVRVLNSTPEPDGVMSRDEAIAIFGDAAQAAINSPEGSRFKQYTIRVPPDMTTAHEAVAWTFGLTAETYHPALET